MAWGTSAVTIKGIRYTVGQKINTLTGPVYADVEGNLAGYQFEELADLYGYEYYFGGTWDAGTDLVSPYGVRLSENGDVFFAASEDNFPPAKYTISYNANGGTGAPSAQTKIYNEALILSRTSPQRTGHIFMQWNTKQDGTGSGIYNPGDVYTANASATLYAIWEPRTYIVSYNANGGTGAPTRQIKTYGKTLVLTNAIPERTGYIFKGWATSETGSVAYQAGSNYTTNASITLYAVWEPIILTVTFDAITNGGVTQTESKRIAYGTRVGILPTATKQYYRFQGWFTQPNGGTKISENQVITTNVIYYAQFKIDASFMEYKSGSWKPRIVFLRKNSQWKKVFAFTFQNGSWHQGIGG